MLMVSKSVPSNSPRALRSHSQRQVARSDPGAAMRAMIEAMAAARSGPLKPSCSRNSPSPSCSIAHSPTCSTPTERGRTISRESTSTLCISPPGRPAPSPERPTSCAAMRCASRSTASEHSSGSIVAWGDRSCEIRSHNTRQCWRSTAKSLPRLSRVCWRTLSPSRRERTRRWEKYALPSPVVLVLVRRMNMAGDYQPFRGHGRPEIHFMALHSASPKQLEQVPSV